jgi:phosphatidylethanolamine/phosphatidyl-N-methylethanolamine N-methyltransferase
VVWVAEDRRGRNSSPTGTSLLAFLRGLLSDPRRTGALSPSGAVLARAIAAEVDPHSDGPVVELGPGTGVITDALIARGISPERLILIEFNPEFCSLLSRRYPEARIVEGDAGMIARHLGAEGPAAPTAVVSGLPLLNFPLDTRVAIITESLSLGPPGMPFIQFSYGLGPPVSEAQAACRIRRARRVLRNLPPATVWVYTRDHI